MENVLICSHLKTAADYRLIYKVRKHVGNIGSLSFFPNDIALFRYLLHSDGLPDLITIDLHLPFLGGLKTLEVLKADKRWNGIPIIMTSVKATVDEIQACYHAGTQSFFVESPVFN